MKISSNSTIYERKKNWIDFNTGALVDDENLDLDTIGQNLYEAVVAVASGKKVKAEEEGYHDLAIFKKGVTL